MNINSLKYSAQRISFEQTEVLTVREMRSGKKVARVVRSIIISENNQIVEIIILPCGTQGLDITLRSQYTNHMNKTFQVINKKGKPEWIVIRQIAGVDKMYKLGDRIPRIGLIIGLKPNT